MHTELMTDKATYECRRCGEKRPYGLAKPPENYDYLPLIDCKHCGEATRHTFLKIEPWPTEIAVNVN